jgi:hypothetical protein
VEITREAITRIKVADLEAYASDHLGCPKNDPWSYSKASGHRGEMSVEYIVPTLPAKPYSPQGILNAAHKAGLIPAGLVIVDTHVYRGLPWLAQKHQMDCEDVAAIRRMASLANR